MTIHSILLQAIYQLLSWLESYQIRAGSLTIAVTTTLHQDHKSLDQTVSVPVLFIDIPSKLKIQYNNVDGHSNKMVMTLTHLMECFFNGSKVCISKIVETPIEMCPE